MREDDKHDIITKYNDRYNAFGVDIRTLASGTHERRAIRFDVLCEIGIAQGSSVLDLGCGFGDLVSHFEHRGIDVDYTGYDINPQLIEAASRRYPKATFRVCDIQRDDFPCFDYILSCSAFNNRLRHADNYAHIDDILATCFRHARKGVAVDFLTNYVDFEAPDAFHYDPGKVFAIAKQYTKRVTLRHDYPLFEFCIYLYPDFKGWRSPPTP